MNPNIRWSLKKDTRLELNSDGKTGILIDTNNANYCSCNKNAIIILKALKKRKTNISGLVKIIASKNNVGLFIARRDIITFINKLKKMKLIK